ncbi:uncharacterized protein [Amphiura filiformis]|uniref:uncharacterized protein n=1 Tax=Amphiura filiformis TaxID=82378 RepID=UPI003B220242
MLITMATRILKLPGRWFIPQVKYFQSQPKHLQILPRSSLSTTACKNNEDAEKPKTTELPWQRSSYKYFLPIQTRWSDNDQYGHVNNVIYYSYFDSIINHYLIHSCGLNTNVQTSKIVGYMVDTRCTFREPISFPEIALAGLAISHIGRSSVQYSVAIFAEKKNQHAKSHDVNYPDHNETACAIGQCTHVFVDTSTNRPIKLPDMMREALETISLNNGTNPTSKL